MTPAGDAAGTAPGPRLESSVCGEKAGPRSALPTTRGYFGLACYRPKTSHNWGSLYRSAQVLGAAFIATIGERFRRMPSDTMRSWAHVPTFCYPDFAAFQAARPYDCVLVGIELTPTAKMLCDYTHMERAIYLLGAEDDGLPPEVLRACQHVVRLPGNRSLNVACAGTAVLADRVMRWSRRMGARS